MKRNGFTLIELIITVAIVGVLTAAAAATATNFVRKYRVESQAQALFNDILTARIQAMHTNVVHFVRIQQGSGGYSVYRDANNDGNLQTATDRIIPMDGSKFVRYPITWSNADDNAPGGGSELVLSFNARGIAEVSRTVCVVSPNVRPRYDCIKISQTRAAIGKMNDQTGGCQSANCLAQ